MPLSSPVPAEPAWAAFAAIDWGSRSHAWSVRPATGGSTECGVLDNTPEAVEHWATTLRERFPDGPIAVAIEQKRGPVIYMLRKYSHVVLYPVPPSMSAAYRSALRPSGAKDDPGDAASLLDLLMHHRDRLRPLGPDTPDTRRIRLLVELRRQLVQQRVRFVQILTDSLQNYFPQLRTWFGSLIGPVPAALLERWPTLPSLQHAHPGTLRRFFGAQHCRGRERIETRVQAIYAAVPATTDEVVVEAYSRRTTAMLSSIGALNEHIAAIDKRIAELVAVHPDAPIFASFPGAGPATVPRLIAAFGTQRDDWRSAADMQKFSGIAPVYIRSGNTRRVVMRRACPKFLRQTFHEFAGQSVPRSPWAKAYYLHHLNGDPKRRHRALRALACRWISILYRCWKDRCLYDERILLDAQRRHNSIFSGKIAPAGSLKWTKQAGFNKLTNSAEP